MKDTIHTTEPEETTKNLEMRDPDFIEANEEELQRLEQLEKECCPAILCCSQEFYPSKPSTHHKMYKLILGSTSKQEQETLPVSQAPRTWLESPDGSRRYEFLLEYSMETPSLGVYFGCKGLTMNGDHDAQVKVFKQEWSEIKDFILSDLQRQLKRDFRNGLKKTDNRNNQTYWPFWWSADSEKALSDIPVKALKIIAEDYQIYLKHGLKKLKERHHPRQEVKDAIYDWLFTSSDNETHEVNAIEAERRKTIGDDFDRLLSLMSRQPSKDAIQKSPIIEAEDPDGHIRISARNNANCHLYLYVWMISQLVQYKIPDDTEKKELLGSFQKASETNRKACDIPWRSFCELFRNHNGEDLKDNLKNACDKGKRAQNFLKIWKILEKEHLIPPIDLCA